MSDIPITCYDGLNKRFKCIKCGFCVSYTMGRTGFKKFDKHFKECKDWAKDNNDDHHHKQVNNSTAFSIH